MFTKAFFAVLALVVVVEAVMVVPIEHHVPQPYKFGYTIKDKHGEQHREEVGDGKSGVKGSYGFTDDRGVQRQVNYVADHAGFRAQVKTNEPGTANQDPAAVNIISTAHPYYGAGYGLGGAGYGGAGYGGAGYDGAGYGGAGYGGAGYGGAGFGGMGFGGAVGYGVPAAGLGLGYGAGMGYGAGTGYGAGMGYGAVSGYDSRYGAY